MTERQYPEDAVRRAKEGALEWLRGNAEGCPRSWAEEARQIERRGYDMYDEFEAPPIAGYEALEREGLVQRLLTVTTINGEERVRFQIIAALGEQGDKKGDEKC